MLFLLVSSVAVYKAVRQSPKRWIQFSMVSMWLMLTFFVLNERFEGIEFPFDMVYIPAFALIALHLINRKHCRCEAGCCEIN